MLDKMITWSITNRSIVLIALVITIISVLTALPKLNLDAFPDVTNIQVTVNTEAPGLAAEEVEQLVTYPIEAVMYALPDVAQVRSISKTGLSGVTVVFREGTDIYFARQLVFERLQTAKNLIPNSVGTPEMGPNTSGLGQVFQYLLIADDTTQFDAMALRRLNDWVVKLLLMPIDGVTDVLSFGGSVRQYQVNIDPAKLMSFGLTQDDLVDALENNNVNAGGWYMDRGQEQLVIRGLGWFKSGSKGLNDIAQVPVKTAKGVVITLSDLAQITIGAEIRQGAMTMTRRAPNNETEHLGEVVSGIVLKRLAANTKETIDGIKARTTLINQALPNGVKFEPYYDQSDLINQAVKTVIHALLLAFIFIAVVLTLFLMNLRATLLVLISIPISIGVALMIMACWGVSANLMSLGGMAVAIGMLVDGSVVMVEQIIKQLKATQTNTLNQQANLSQQQINSACIAVARPVFFAAAIILVVFAPLFSFEGVEAKLFQPMAISIMLAVASAVIVALFVVPALATFMFKKGIKQRSGAVLSSIEKVYRSLLSRSLNMRTVIIIGAFTLSFLTLLILPKIGTEFVPELEEGTINLRVTLAPSASLETALSVAPVLEQKLMAFPEVNYALSRIGRAEIGGDPEPVNNIEIYISLKPVSEWTSAENRTQQQDKMAESLADYPGLMLNFSQPIATRVDELLSGVKAELAVKLFGPDLSVLASKGKELETLIKSVAGTQDVALEQLTGEAQLIIQPNRQALSRYGLSVSDVMKVVHNGIGGINAGQIINGNERYDIVVQLAKRFRSSPEAIADIRLQSPAGAWVRIGDVASESFNTGAVQIRRDDVQRRVVVEANVKERDMGSVVNDINAIIATDLNLPTGYSVIIGGQFESQQRAQKRLSIVVPISLLLIALLLYFAFNSLLQALLILSNIPLAIIGGVFSLYFSGQYLSVPSTIGFITLFGIAVLNGVVMVESINQCIKRGLSSKEAILVGAQTRLRPVLITALTSVLGLIPMLLSTGVGAEIQRPLASVIVGGLLTSTLLTLFVIPSLYTSFSKSKMKALQAYN